ncbi:MAG: lamin tail domain-containing protein [Bacteroidales bacterium]|nr:lamin tail domain-containing protein [Bacteroidales bacterium]
MKFFYIILVLMTIAWSIPAKSQVVINEYSASNLNQFVDNYQEYEDWFELYNPNTWSVNIGGYFLSDRPGNPMKWEIPANTTLSANGFLKIWASGRNLVSGSNYHTNFKLHQTKDSPDHIILSDPEGTIIDSLQLQITQLGHSRGRSTNGGALWVIFTSPTPGASNNSAQAYLRYAKRPQMSHEAGFYDGSQTITITCDDPEAQIRYTTNGNVPTSNSQLYTNPLPVNNTLVLQARAFHPSAQVLPSLIEFNTYFINVTHTLPVMSATGDQLTQLLNGNAGLRPQGSFEYFNENHERTNIAYGEFNKHGQDSWVNPQRSIDWITRDEMGYNYAIREKLLPLSDRDEFQRLILRAAGDDNYPGKDTSAHMRDIWTQNLAQKSGMHLDVRKGARAILYANGQFWGIYSIREKVSDHDFTDFYYGQGKFDIQFLMYWGGLWAQYGGQQAINDWMELRTYILTNNVTDPFVFSYIDSKYDYKSLVDYVIINSFVVCSDWLNWNVGWWRGLNPDGGHQKWGYILWDDDAILGHYINYTGIPGQHPYVPPCFPENLSSYSDPQKHIEILNKLKTNPDFYHYYVSRYIDLKNTIFIKEDLLTYLDSMSMLIAPEMPQHVTRWGGTVTKWNSNVLKMRNFISARCDYLDQGLKDCYGLTGPYQLTLNVEPEGVGVVHLNSLDLDHFPWSGEYFGGIDVKLEAEATNFNYEFDYWELVNHTPNPGINSPRISVSLTEWDILIAHFKPKLYTDSLVINEINYRSAAWFDPEDWVEFYNPHEYDLDITGWVFKDSNDNNAFTFPQNTIVESNSYLVLCRDTAAFKIHFPQVSNFIGDMDFGFDSNGELLRLYNPEGILIDTVHYGINSPWPQQPNGGGPTLELIHPWLDNALGENWLASSLYGTPGAMNSYWVSTPDLVEPKQNLSITIFPNPATSVVTVYANDDYLITDGMLQIFNSFGKQVMILEGIKTDRIEVQVEQFPKGLYIFKLSDNKNGLTANRKVVIK